MIVNNNPSLTIINNDPLLTIVNIIVNKIFLQKTIVFLKTIVKKLVANHFIKTMVSKNDLIRFLKVQKQNYRF